MIAMDATEEKPRVGLAFLTPLACLTFAFGAVYFIWGAAILNSGRYGATMAACLMAVRRGG
jgi:hypothetical protein